MATARTGGFMGCALLLSACGGAATVRDSEAMRSPPSTVKQRPPFVEPDAPQHAPSAAPATAPPAVNVDGQAPAERDLSPPPELRDDFLSLPRQDLELQHAEPDALTREEAHIEADYAALSDLPEPDFLHRVALRHVLPPSCLDTMGSDSSHLELRGGFIDELGERFLLWVSYGGIESALILLDGEGNLLDRLAVPLRMSVLLRDVIEDATQEIFVERIEGTALSTWPITWVVYRVDKRGKFRKIVEHAKSHSSGAKHRRWSLLNRFVFEPNALRIETLISSCEPPERCPVEGKVVELKYDRACGCYVRR